MGAPAKMERMTSSWREIGESWLSVSVGADEMRIAIHFGFDIGQGPPPIDKTGVAVVPEPMTPTMAVLGTLRRLFRQRRR